MKKSSLLYDASTSNCKSEGCGGIKRTLFAGVILALAYTSNQAEAVTIDYGTLGTFQTSSLDHDSVTVTGSADINVLNLNGLGIVGGSSNNFVDSGESIQFSFNSGSAIDVSYFIKTAFDTNGGGLLGERTLEAFDTSNNSLGTIMHDFVGLFDVTALFGDLPISRFTLTSPGWDTFLVGAVIYSPVPIPASIWLFGSGLLGLVGIARRKKA